jgi:diaminopimelate decarboxylase
MDKSTSTPAINGNHLSNSWLNRSELKLIAEQVGTPVFIYSEDQVVRNVARIRNAAKAAEIDKRVELYVPFFPNSNPHILGPLQELDVGLLLQLPSEYKILSKFGFDKFIISPGHVSDEDIKFWSKTGHPLFLSSLDEITYLLRIDPKASINVRLDSLSSGKPGLKYSQLKDLSELLAAHNRELDCFELYCGSGNSVNEMISIIEQVFMIFMKYFPKAKSVNFAGGYGFIYEEWNESEKHFEWHKYFENLREIADRSAFPST